jgi:multidrug efflux pump subunit AcrA (membrane-fusion protein)
VKGYNRSWSRLILTLSLFVILITGCAKKTTATIITSQETTTSQEVTVGKGTITISITTSAIVDYADYENMSFGAGGNINEVNAKIGDLVKKDKKLATIIPSSWSPQIEDLAQSVQALQIPLITYQLQ